MNEHEQQELDIITGSSQSTRKKENWDHKLQTPPTNPQLQTIQEGVWKGKKILETEPGLQQITSIFSSFEA